MRTKAQTLRASGGYLLIEYLIYIAVLAVVMEVAFSAFYRFLNHSRDLARNTDEILRTMQVGELWRADIRAATAPPEVRSAEGVSACEITRTNGTVAYVFGDGAVWRQEASAPAKIVLPRVRASTMIHEQRQGITCWRWELELQTRHKVVRVRPLFTFQAVPSLTTP
jgi:hypothetical protein